MEWKHSAAEKKPSNHPGREPERKRDEGAEKQKRVHQMSVPSAQLPVISQLQTDYFCNPRAQTGWREDKARSRAMQPAGETSRTCVGQRWKGRQGGPHKWEPKQGGVAVSCQAEKTEPRLSQSHHMVSKGVPPWGGCILMVPNPQQRTHTPGE